MYVLQICLALSPDSFSLRQNITQRFGVDLYECRIDKDTGFKVVPLGPHPSEKVVDFRWSPFGGLFCLSEKESGLSAKQIWSTYMIVSQIVTKPEVEAGQEYTKWKGKIMKV
jgi:hypothetical protein